MRFIKSRAFCVALLIVFTALISFEAVCGADVKNTTDVFLSKIFNKAEINPMLSEENSLIVISPESVNFETENPSVTFEGYCLPENILKINTLQVDINANGLFTFEYVLDAGENIITLSDGNKTYVYSVVYNFSIVKDFSPDTDISLNSGMILEISAVALSGAKVYADIGDTVIEMTADDVDGNIFKEYKGEYLIPDIQQDELDLGTVKINAEFGNYTEEKIGGNITALKNKSGVYRVKSGQGDIVIPEFTADNTVKLLSPKEDHKEGNAAMCMVTKNYAEVVPASTADDKNDPRYSPQMIGTVDYIVGECKFDDQEYYLLLSGVKIDKKNVDAFSGYILPMNTVSSTISEDSTLTLTMNWKVPFISEMKEQSYYIGHAARVFNVKGFTSAYIDFVFKYTNAAQSNVNFDDSPVISHAQWINIGEDGTSTLRVFFRNKGGFYGYKAYYSQDNRLNIKFKRKPDRSSRFVVIDPGHGGIDCGAIGTNGVYESEINLKISNMIKQNLENSGVRVEFTRYSDELYTLDQRQDFARASNADLFVALHNNATETSALSGTEVYYYRANSQPLAEYIHTNLVNAWKRIYADNSFMSSKIVPNDGGVRFFPFQVTRIEECPAVLVECGYLSNELECKMLCDSDNQKLLADAVSNGILDYLNSL